MRAASASKRAEASSTSAAGCKTWRETAERARPAPPGTLGYKAARAELTRFMATASRPKGPKTRSGTSSVSVMLAFDAVRPWLIPGLAAAAIVVSAALASAGLVSTPVGLAIAIAGALVLLLYIGMRRSEEHTSELQSL